jgi:hypothetical protein
MSKLGGLKDQLAKVQKGVEDDRSNREQALDLKDKDLKNLQ